MEKRILGQAGNIWENLKKDFYAKSGLSTKMEWNDYEDKYREELSDEDVLTELFERIMLIEAHLSNEDLDDVEAELLEKLASCFDYV